MAGRELLSPEGLRLDGRRFNEVRRVRCQLGIFSKTDGSALYEQGNTKVTASVFGPQEARRRGDTEHDRCVVRVEYTVSPFSSAERRRVGKGDRRSVEAALMIRQTFEQAIMTKLFPRSEISIFIQVLEADGGEISAAVNAATLALINAGVPMQSFVCACSSGLADGQAVVDVNYVEKSGGCSEVVVASDPVSNAVFMAQMTSKVPAAHFEEVLNLATEGCSQIHKLLRKQVMDHALSLRSDLASHK